jgi:hypothetical protein
MLGTGAGSESEYQAATNAIDHIGVAALPFLVKWAYNDPPKWKSNLGVALYRIGLQSTAERMMTGARIERLANGTHECFRILGSRALPVVDDLGSSLVSGTNDPATSVILILGLRCFGTNALPALFTVPSGQLVAVYVLGNLKAAPKVSLPAIAFCLQSTDAELRAGSAEALGNFGGEALSFVPALTNALLDASPSVRKSATEALRRIQSAFH